LVTLLLDQKIAEVSASSQVLLGLAFLGALWGFISHEKKIQSPMIDLSFFSILLWLRLARFTFVLYHAGHDELRHAFLFAGRAQALNRFYRHNLSRSVATEYVLSPVSGALTIGSARAFS